MRFYAPLSAVGKNLGPPLGFDLKKQAGIVLLVAPMQLNSLVPIHSAITAAASRNSTRKSDWHPLCPQCPPW